MLGMATCSPTPTVAGVAGHRFSCSANQLSDIHLEPFGLVLPEHLGQPALESAVAA